MMEKKKEKKNVQKTHSVFSMFLFFLCVCGDDKKMENFFSAIPPKHIKKRDRDITIADR
jgi:hypothetical protein